MAEHGKTDSTTAVSGTDASGGASRTSQHRRRVWQVRARLVIQLETDYMHPTFPEGISDTLYKLMLHASLVTNADHRTDARYCYMYWRMDLA